MVWLKAEPKLQCCLVSGAPINRVDAELMGNEGIGGRIPDIDINSVEDAGELARARAEQSAKTLSFFIALKSRRRTWAKPS